MFDVFLVNMLEVVVKDLCFKLDVFFLIIMFVCFVNYVLNVSEYMKLKELFVDMYLNVFGGVLLENCDKLILGIIF